MISAGQFQDHVVGLLAPPARIGHLVESGLHLDEIRCVVLAALNLVNHRQIVLHALFDLIQTKQHLRATALEPDWLILILRDESLQLFCLVRESIRSHQRQSRLILLVAETVAQVEQCDIGAHVLDLGRDQVQPVHAHLQIVQKVDHGVVRGVQLLDIEVD